MYVQTSTIPLASIQVTQPDLSEKLYRLMFRIHNWICLNILEPLSAFFKDSDDRNNAKNVLSWMKKRSWTDISNCPDFSSVKLDAAFFNSPQFQTLTTIDPDFNPSDRASYVDKLNQMFEGGTCYGQALTVLKYGPYLKMQCPPKGKGFGLNATQNIRNDAIFFHTHQYIRHKFNAVQHLHATLKERGIDPEYLFDEKGELDEAKAFYYLGKTYPSLSHSTLRGRISLIKTSAFKLSEKELEETIEKSEQAFNRALKAPIHPHAKPGSYKDRQWMCTGLYPETGKLAADFFLNHHGSFSLGSVYPGNGGHAIFMKVNDRGCLVFDPNLKSWLFYKDAEKGITETINYMEKLIGGCWYDFIHWADELTI